MIPARTTPAAVRRGQVWVVDLDPVLGSEANKTRPAVVVSNDAANGAVARLGRGTVTVVPVTSSTTRVLAFQVALPKGAGGLDRDSKAQAEQVRTVDVRRLVSRLGELDAPLVHRLDAALRLHLGL
ncbi:MAG: type II toxin-antitoxin system PemK/MazF family toxin [Kineosporiaceae bacterium]